MGDGVKNGVKDGDLHAGHAVPSTCSGVIKVSLAFCIVWCCMNTGGQAQWIL